jgi:hypothetical protein
MLPPGLWRAQLVAVDTRSGGRVIRPLTWSVPRVRWFDVGTWRRPRAVFTWSTPKCCTGSLRIPTGAVGLQLDRPVLLGRVCDAPSAPSSPSGERSQGGVFLHFAESLSYVLRGP